MSETPLPQSEDHARRQVNLTVDYFSEETGTRKWSHAYDELWSETELYCPNCAWPKVWMRDDPGDYYVGEQYLCSRCEFTFYLPNGVRLTSVEQDRQRLDAIQKKEGQVVESSQEPQPSSEQKKENQS